MAASRIAAVKAALLTTIKTSLAADSDAANIQVTYGLPFTNRAAEVVAMGNARSTQQPVTLGNRSRDEDIEADVIVSVQYGGGDEIQQSVTERAFAILALVESALRTDPTLGGVVLWCEPLDISLTETTEEAAADGRFADVVLTTTSRARL